MMKKYRFTSGLTIGLIVGALLMISSSTFAALEEKIEAYFGQYTIQVNGELADLEDSKIIVKEGTTYLPVRKLANILGYDVTYLADSRTIVLNSGESDKIEGGAENQSTQTEGGILKVDYNHIPGRILIEYLAEKYPELSESLELTIKGALTIDSTVYQLEPYIENDGTTTYGIGSLIEAGVIIQADVEAMQATLLQNS